jgi:protease-4
MKLMEMMMGTESTSKGGRSPKIAVVYAVGTIMPGESKPGFMSDEALGGETIAKAIRQAEEDAKVKAIVLRVDSPGGSALASDLIWREVVRAKKPVVASMGDIAASGGYYISMGAKKIFAEPGTLTGSIGVVGGKLAIKGLLTKIGVTTEVIRRGKNSGTLSITDPFTDEERDAWKRMMTETYGQFTTKAAAGRKMNLEKLESLAQGRVFSGRMAVENGLVDTLGTLEDAIAAAKEMAGLKAADKVEILILPQPKSFFEHLFGGAELEAETRATALELAPQLVRQAASAQLLIKLFSERAVAIMPYRVEFK